jgi:hypothetical protein
MTPDDPTQLPTDLASRRCAVYNEVATESPRRPVCGLLKHVAYKREPPVRGPRARMAMLQYTRTASGRSLVAGLGLLRLGLALLLLLLLLL